MCVISKWKIVEQGGAGGDGEDYQPPPQYFNLKTTYEKCFLFQKITFVNL